MSDAEQKRLTFNDVDELARKHGLTLITSLTENKPIVVENLKHLLEQLDIFVKEGFSDVQALLNFLNAVVLSFPSSTTIKEAEEIDVGEEDDVSTYYFGLLNLVLSGDSTQLTIAKKINNLNEDE